MKNANIIIRIEPELKEMFYQIVTREGYRASEVVLTAIKDICKKDKIPLNIISYLGVKKEKNKVCIPHIKRALEEIIDMEFKEKIEKAYLFGSYSRGEETENSDIDIRLITKGAFDLFDLQTITDMLKEKLNKDVDVITSGNLDVQFLSEIKKDEICIYE